MADDAHQERLRQHQAWRVEMQEMQQRMAETHRVLEGQIQEQRAMIPRLDAMIARFDAMIARFDARRAHLDQVKDNGRDA